MRKLKGDNIVFYVEVRIKDWLFIAEVFVWVLEIIFFFELQIRPFCCFKSNRFCEAMN